MSNLKVNSVVDANGGNTATINGLTPTISNMSGKNRIINGDMRIDQRNAGASTTTTDYTLDRWRLTAEQSAKLSVQRNAGAVTPPNGFSNYLGATSLSAYSISSSDYFSLDQYVEGNNWSDLAWGTASAQSATLSFWVRSSLTGSFGGVIKNAKSGATRSYPFTYTISAANTWEYKTVTVAGDTSGSWASSTDVGVCVAFGLGVGSSLSGAAGSWAGANYLGANGATSVVGTDGATFYITGAQLEAGTVATPFERRQFGQELALCQRYLPAFVSTSTNNTIPGSFFGAAATAASGSYSFMVRSRVPPTGITISSGSHFTLTRPSTGSITATGINFAAAGTDAAQLEFTAASGLVADQSYFARSNNASAYILFTGCEL